jgi:hypothetical protein
MTIEKTPTSDGRHITYRLPGNLTFNLENMESPQSDAAAAFETSVETLAATRIKADSIASDARLSPTGRAEMLAPVHAEAISNLAGAWWHVSYLEQKITSQETALLKVPDIEPTHVVCAIEDREVRDHFRSLSPAERMKMIADMESDPAKHQRVQIAMLRSPIALLEHEAKLLRKLWTDARRAANPSEAAAIDHGRRSAEWARRGLLILGGLFRSTTEIESRDLLRKVLLDGNPRRATGYGVFGFNQAQAANEERILSGAMGYFRNAEGVWRKAA